MSAFRIPEIAKQYIEYDMIQNHTDLPAFPEFRTRLLYECLNSNSKLVSSSELFALVTSLVQMGLDVHDTVSVTNDIKEKKAARSRQLRVLAGDYFSTRFYQLLSQAGQIDLVRKLSTAICEVNRLKMSLYMRMKGMKMTADEYLQNTVQIKSELFLCFSEWMDDIHRHSWQEALNLLTSCEVIFNELFRADSLVNIRESWGFWHIMQNGSKEERSQMQDSESDLVKIHALFHKYNISSQLYHMLDTNLKKLREKLHLFDSDKLKGELSLIGDAFMNYVSAPKVLKDL
jgi:heptaprenyl diphosphate synthase